MSVRFNLQAVVFKVNKYNIIKKEIPLKTILFLMLFIDQINNISLRIATL